MLITLICSQGRRKGDRFDILKGIDTLFPKYFHHIFFVGGGGGGGTIFIHFLYKVLGKGSIQLETFSKILNTTMVSYLPLMSGLPCRRGWGCSP